MMVVKVQTFQVEDLQEAEVQEQLHPLIQAVTMVVQEELEYQMQFQDPQLFTLAEAEAGDGITLLQELAEMVAVEMEELAVLDLQEQLTLVAAVAVVDRLTLWAVVEHTKVVMVDQV
jgi:hypothetical protein